MSRYFLGVDFGSAYTKYVVASENGDIQSREVLPTLTRHKKAHGAMMDSIKREYEIAATCATGYGRDHVESDIQKTELICVSVGVSSKYGERKQIIDIGGEDIKIIDSGAAGEVERFYMNDKCAAGTGAFITEVAEKLEIEIGEMSELAQKSNSPKVINSFCTVFAKSEVLAWKFNDMPVEDMARGIYLSIIDRLKKLPVSHELPAYLCGGVVAHHPFLAELMGTEMGMDIRPTVEPQYMVALGAALIARRHYASS